MIEAMVAIVFITVALLALAGLQSHFASITATLAENTCLINGAVSAIESCKAGQVINSVRCGSWIVNVNVQVQGGSCTDFLTTPPPVVCKDIVARATLNNKVAQVVERGCNI